MLLVRRERIRCPQRWLIRALKLRCVAWWRVRLDAFYRQIDLGVLAVLASPQIPATERESLRARLCGLTDRLEPRCRDRLRRRYGLENRPTPEDRSRPNGVVLDVLLSVGLESTGLASEEIAHCVAAMMRRLRAEAV